MATSRAQRAECVVADRPGAVLTEVCLRAGLVSGRLPVPRATAEGLEVELPGRPGWRVTVRSEGDGSRVVLEAPPPPWPFSLGWAERTLRRLVSGGLP